MQKHDFEVGKIHFMVSYCDKEKLFPYIDSLVFVGKNLETEVTRETWYFQNTESFFELGAFPNNRPGDGCTSHVYLLHEKDLFQIFDVAGLAAELLSFESRTSATQKGSGVP